MQRNPSRAVGALLALFVANAGWATGSATVIDSEQRAAAATLTALRVGDYLPRHLAGMTYSVKDFTERTLRLLEAGYTPAQLAAIKGGVEVACPAGGSFSARFLKHTSRVLEIDWKTCVIEISGQSHILTGPGQVTLPADDFTPAAVFALSVGDRRRDLIEDFIIDGVPSGPANRIERKVGLVGYIPFGRETVDHEFEGAFSYELDGYVRTVFTQRVAVPGEVFARSETLRKSDHSWVSGELRFGELDWLEDVRLNLGEFSERIHRGAYLDQPEERVNSSVRGFGLRARNAGDYQTNKETLLLGGWANVIWPANSGLACSNGGYSFTTRTPITNESGVEAFDAGEIVMNGSTTLRFSLNGDPELGAMHIDLDVRGVGQFDYDGNSVGETLLPAAAQCSN